MNHYWKKYSRTYQELVHCFGASAFIFLKYLRPVRSLFYVIELVYKFKLKFCILKCGETRYMSDFGKVFFKIDEVLEKKNISKNKLEKEANLQRTQLNSYCNNKVKRIDLETIAKICHVLDCKIEDIMEYER